MSRVKQAPVLALIALAVAGCGSGHQKVNPPMPGTVPSTPADIAIARVQADAGPGFAMFPNGATRTGCLIPGAVALRIKGTCQTRVSHEVRSGRSVTVVTFTESWPARKFRTHGPPIGTLHHSWRYEIRANGRIVSGGGDGAFPPQASE
jgi:hypothetical protein